MLITLVNTSTSDGKFVLHKYPYEKISLQQLGLQKNSISDIQAILNEHFDSFGTYRKKSLIPTSTSPIPAAGILEDFIANSRNSQVVLGVDDDCVLVSRSVQINTQKNLGGFENYSGDNAELSEVADDCDSIVNSISLIWRLDGYEGVEEAKHRLSFILGVLQRKEENDRYLTKEIKKVLEEKQNIKKRIKDLIAVNTRDNSQHYEEIRIKILMNEIDSNAKRIREKIGLFQMLREYYESWVSGKTFEVKQDEGIWEGTIGRRMNVQPPPNNFEKNVQHKTLVMLPPKVVQMLPSVLYSQRVKRLYEKGFALNHLSFKKILQKSDLNTIQLYHTVHFLLKNNLAVNIYPINHPHSYNLFYLRQVPQKNIIDKFNQRIFPGKNFLQVILPYSHFKVAKDQEQTLKYLLVKEIVGEVKIHIYRRCQKQKEEGKDSMLEEMLSKYSMSQKDLNHLLSVQPFPFSKESCLFNNIVKFIKENHKQWGFYFVQ